MGAEGSSGKDRTLAIGCLCDIAIVALVNFMLGYDMMVSSLAYAIAIYLLMAALSPFLKFIGINGLLSNSFTPPVLLALAAFLAYANPIEVEGADGTKEPANPGNVSTIVAEKVVEKVSEGKINELGKPKKNPGPKAGPSAPKGGADASGLEVPPGVRYTPAPTNETVTVDEALEELNGLIGLGEVKHEVEKFTKFVQVAKQRQAAGLKVAPISYHMVFTGNPGTGKTTVARIMAKIYRALGVVKKGHLVEVDKGGLIAEYVGQTAVKTGKVIDFALDGVLFIDEAYAITEGDGKQGYGSECIATLLKRMEDDRDRLIVIVAGYPDEMKRFIDTNPGLESRFNRYIHFPDYSAQELAEMYRLRAKNAQYTLSADVERWLVPYIAVRTEKRDRKFGNGRWVRNEFEKAVERQAMRVADIENPTTEDLMTLTMHDVGIKLKDPDQSAED